MFSFFLNYLLLESHVATAFVNIKGLVGCDLVCQDSLHRALMQSITRHENQARRKSRKPRSLETTAHLCLPEKRTFNSDNKADSDTLHLMLCEPIKKALAMMGVDVTENGCQLASGTEFKISVCRPNEILERNDICSPDTSGFCPAPEMLQTAHSTFNGRDSATDTNKKSCVNQISSGQRLVCNAVLADKSALWTQTTNIRVTYMNPTSQRLTQLDLALVTHHTSKCCGRLAWTGVTSD